MTARLCAKCGKPLPYGRKRYCSATCTVSAMNTDVASIKYECRVCGAKMYTKTTDGLCVLCRDLIEKRKSDPASAKAFESALKEKDKRKDSALTSWRAKSKCYRCVYGTPIYDNVVFCNSTCGTCILEEQKERVRNARKEGEEEHG